MSPAKKMKKKPLKWNFHILPHGAINTVQAIYPRRDSAIKGNQKPLIFPGSYSTLQ